MGRRLIAASLLVAALAVGGCGSQGIQLAEDDPDYQGARLFDENCAGCHTLSTVGSHGSTTNVASRELRDGPNFDERQVTEEDVLYAIRNGGFSSGPMPQNILTGEDAERVARFVAKYSGGGAAEGEPGSSE